MKENSATRYGVNIKANDWYWVAIPGHLIDWMRPWPHRAVCEVENDGSGFAVQGKDIIKGVCTVTTYTAKKDGVTREIILDGWHPGEGGEPATRIKMFGVDTVLRFRNDYTGENLDLTKEQLSRLSLA